MLWRIFVILSEELLQKKSRSCYRAYSAFYKLHGVWNWPLCTTIVLFSWMQVIRLWFWWKEKRTVAELLSLELIISVKLFALSWSNWHSCLFSFGDPRVGSTAHRSHKISGASLSIAPCRLQYGERYDHCNASVNATEATVTRANYLSIFLSVSLSRTWLKSFNHECLRQI